MAANGGETNADVLAAVQAAFAANGTAYESAHYIDFARNDLGQIPNDGSPIALGANAPVGVMAKGTRTFDTYLAKLAGVGTLGTVAEATAIAGTATGVCSSDDGCAVVPGHLLGQCL